MTSVRIVWLALCLLWVISEIRLARNSRPLQKIVLNHERRTQWLLWLSVLACLSLALWLKQRSWLPIPIEYLPRQLLAIMLFACGLGLRYLAICQLGRFFTTDVTIQQKHQLITSGPYRWIRHPAYSGLLLALAAAGLAMGDFLALLSLSLPTFLAFKSRIEVEEQMLRQAFQEDYINYSQSSWKLLPWLF
jgi:protein-S-isoprenylcysteine O-methyltransferase Ste14